MPSKIGIIGVVGPAGCPLAAAAVQELAAQYELATVRLATEEEMALAAVQELPIERAVLPFHLRVRELEQLPHLVKPPRPRYNRQATRPYPNPYSK